MLPSSDFANKPMGITSTNNVAGYTVNACNVASVYDACLNWQPSGSITYNYSIPSWPNKFEQSFKIAAMLMEQGLIEECSIPKFCELIKQIQAEL